MSQNGSSRGGPGGPGNGPPGSPGGRARSPPRGPQGTSQGPQSPTSGPGRPNTPGISGGPGGRLDSPSRRPQGSPPQRSGSPPRQASPPPGSGTGGPGQAGPPGARTNPFPQGPGHDPGRLAPRLPEREEKLKLIEKRIDLPAEAYLQDPGKHRFAKRPGFNTQAQPIKMQLNQFRVTKLNANMDIYQYDVSVTPVGNRPGAVFKKVWNHPTVQNMLQSTGARWLCDGRKLAWAPVMLERGEARLTVDLDADKAPEKRKPPFFCVIRQTTKIRLASLRAYLLGQMSWDNSVLEAMNFLDHVIRQHPSDTMVSIKRNFFQRGSRPFKLDDVVEVFKGTYCSIRMNQSIQNGGLGLGLNVDVTNTAFWTGGKSLYDYIMAYLPTANKAFRTNSPQAMCEYMRPRIDHRGGGKLDYQMSDAFKLLRRFQKLRFTVRQDGKIRNPKEYVVGRFEFGPTYGRDGANATNVTFDLNGTQTTVVDYFRSKYGIILAHPQFPVVITPKDEKFPVEVCIVKEWQRYPYKLDPEQTSKMIRIAVTRPPQRKADILQAARNLDWAGDPYLRDYGIDFERRFAETDARLIPNPEVEYANGRVNPRTSGRWDLRGKKFWRQNKRPLKGWAIVAVENCVQKQAAEAFAKQFKSIYAGHGGIVQGDPVLISSSADRPAMVTAAYKACIEKAGTCDLIFFILPNKDSTTYERLKKSADCRYGVVSQCVQSVHVYKNQGQYHSNVAMKVNCKLGGSTCRAAPTVKGAKTAFFKERTMQIGVDVSHAAPGSPAASMAAMSMSMDPDATFFGGVAETNGHRVEMISNTNINKFMYRLAPQFKKKCGDYPTHIYYFRDGVSEGQFAHVINQEVDALKGWFNRENNGRIPKFTVIVATKRHHIRFFPPDDKGDKNSNPLPGSVVEKEVTHPFQWDFYLCSHVAIQGTARPVHYHVLMDEANCNPVELQKMIYHQCYQYARSTTPVSLHPAVYYAHLIGSRARAHENVSSEELPRSGGKAVEIIVDSISKGMSIPGENAPFDVEVPPLLPLGGSDEKEKASAHPLDKEHIRATMWYI